MNHTVEDIVMSHANKQSLDETYKNIEKQCAKDDAYDRYYFKHIDTEDSVSNLFGEFNEEYELDCRSRAKDMR